MKNQKTVTVRISEEILSKLAFVSQSEGRSLNNQFLLLARNSIAYFEKNKGKITPAQQKAALEAFETEKRSENENV